MNASQGRHSLLHHYWNSFAQGLQWEAVFSLGPMRRCTKRAWWLHAILIAMLAIGPAMPTRVMADPPSYSFAPQSGTSVGLYEGQSTTLIARLTTDDGTGIVSPVAGVWVDWVDGNNTSLGGGYTDSNGDISYGFSTTTVGTYNITAREGFTGQNLTVSFQVGVSAQYTMNTVSGGGTINEGQSTTLTAQLWDNVNAGPVSSASVEWRDEYGNWLSGGTTDGSGYASFEYSGGIGSHTVTVTAPGHSVANPATASFGITVQGNPSYSFTAISGGGGIYEGQSTTLVARLTTLDGQGNPTPVSNAWVEWWDGNNNQVGSSYTDSNGDVSYTFQSGSTLGDYSFTARESYTGQYLTAGFGVTVSGQYSMNQQGGGGTLYQGQSTTLTAQLYDNINGSYVTSAFVEWRDGNGNLVSSTYTDGGGYTTFEFSGSSLGNYAMTVTAPSHSNPNAASTTFAIEVVPAVSYSLTAVSGSPVGIIEGQSTTLVARLTYNDGYGNISPVSSAWVEWVDSNNSPVGTGYTDSNGDVSYTFPGTTALGTYAFTAREGHSGQNHTASFEVNVSRQYTLNVVSGGGSLGIGQTMTLTAQLWDNLNGGPVPYANVEWRDENGNQLASTSTDWNGNASYDYTGGSEGNHTVTVTAPANSSSNPAATSFGITVDDPSYYSFTAISGGGGIYEEGSTTLVARLVYHDGFGGESPVSSAYVEWLDGNNSQVGSGYTDGDGYVSYTFQSGSTLGDYNFTARENYTGNSLTAGFGVSVSQRYAMIPVSGGGTIYENQSTTLTVRLWDNLTGTSVPDAPVEWRDQNGNWLNGNSTDVDGFVSYEFYPPGLGNYSVSVTAPYHTEQNHATASFSISAVPYPYYSLTPVSPTPQTVYEEESTTLVARLTYHDGYGNTSPVYNAWVEWLDSNGSQLGSGYTDSNGDVSYTLQPGSTLGSRPITARATNTDGSPSASFDISVAARYTMNAVSGGGNLGPGQTMTLTAQLWDNVSAGPVPYASIEWRDENGNMLPSISTDANGYTTLDYYGGSEGSHTVTVTATGNTALNPASTSFAINVQDLSYYSFTAVSGGGGIYDGDSTTLVARLTYHDGYGNQSPVNSAWVEWLDSGSNVIANGYTDGNGEISYTFQNASVLGDYFFAARENYTGNMQTANFGVTVSPRYSMINAQGGGTVLEGQTLGLTAQLWDNSGNSPVPYAYIEWRDENGNWLNSTYTDGNGYANYDYYASGAGSHTVSMTAPGHSAAYPASTSFGITVQSYSLSPVSSTPVSIYEGNSTILVARLTFNDGSGNVSAVTSAPVEWLDSNYNPITTTYTDSNGDASYTFQGGTAGTQVFFAREGYSGMSLTTGFEVSVSPQYSMSIISGGGAVYSGQTSTLTARLWDNVNSVPGTAATVDWRDQNGNLLHSTSTDGNGYTSYDYYAGPLGDYTVSVTAPGHSGINPASVNFDIAVVPTPSYSLSVVSANPANIYEGQSTTLTAQLTYDDGYGNISLVYGGTVEWLDGSNNQIGSGSTDGNGQISYTFQSPTATGTYNITARELISGQGHTASFQVNVAAQYTMNAVSGGGNLGLGGNVTLTAQLWDNVNGGSVPYASVDWRDENGNQLSSSSTDWNGYATYEYYGSNEGSHTVTVTAPGHSNANPAGTTFSINVQDSSFYSFSAVSGGGGLYEGQSTTLVTRLVYHDSQGNQTPVNNATVEWRDGSNNFLGTSYTDSNGEASFTFQGSSVGNYSIIARETYSGDNLTAGFEVSVSGQYGLSQWGGGGTVYLGQSSTLNVQLWDNLNGSAVPYATVEWYDQNGNLLSTTSTDSSGFTTYEYYGGTFGDYTVRARAPGYTGSNPATTIFGISVRHMPYYSLSPTSASSVDVYEGQSTPLAARLIYSDEWGTQTAVSGAWVEWLDNIGSQIGSSYTDGNGDTSYSFQANNLPAGIHAITAREAYSGQYVSTVYSVNVLPPYSMIAVSGGGTIGGEQSTTLTARLWDNVNSAPVPYASVEWRDNFGNVLATNSTDEQGYVTYVFSGGMGSRTVTVIAYGHTSMNQASNSFGVEVNVVPYYIFTSLSGGGDVFEGQSMELVAEMTYNDGYGNVSPAPNIEVEWRDASNTYLGGVTTDGSGRASFSFQSDILGNHSITARDMTTGEGHTTGFSVNVLAQYVMEGGGGGTVEWGESATLVAQLWSNSSSATVSGASVEWRDENGTFLSSSSTDGDGNATYVYTANSVGDHFITATAPGHSSANPASVYIPITVPQPPVPNAPTQLQITAATTTSVNLAWSDNATNETGFVIQRSIDGGSNWSNAGTPAANATTAQLTGLVGSDSYDFRIYAVYGPSQSPPSNTVHLIARPAIATNVTVEATAWNTALVEWTLPADSTRTAVVLRGYETGSAQPRLVETLAAGATNYTDSSLEELHNYSYRIATVNTRGETATSPVHVSTPPKPLDAPSGLSLTGSSPTSASISWEDNSTTETGFRVERSVDNTTFTVVASVGSNATSYSDATLQENSDYFYRVHAYRTISGQPEQTSDTTNVIQVRSPFAMPSAPVSVVVSNLSPHGLQVNWQAGGTNQLYYEVQVSADGGNTWQSAGTVQNGQLSRAIGGLTEKTSYQVRVAAVNPTGFAPSSAVTVQTPADAPALPSALAIASASGTTCTLTWLDNATNETGYLIQQSNNGGSSWTNVNTVAADTTTFSVSGLVGSATYQFRVMAVNAGIFSDPSNVASLIALPSIPTSVSAQSTVWHTVVVNWSLPADATRTGVRVTGYVSGAPQPRLVVDLPATATSFSDSGLQAQTAYQYTVAALNARGENPAGAVNVTTPSSLPALPTNVIAVANGPRKVTVTWADNAADETKYVVQRSTTSGFSSFVSSPDLPAGTTSYVDTTGLQGATAYYYRVVVTNAFGNRTSSSYAVTTLNYPTPNRAPDALAVQPRGNQAFTADARFNGRVFGVSDDIDPIGNYWVIPASPGDGRNIAAVVQVVNGDLYLVAWVEPASETWDADQAFGAKITVSGNRIFVGAPNARKQAGNTSSVRCGAVFVYDWNGSTATQVQRIVPSDGGAGDYFGGAIAVDGDRLIVGAPLRDVTQSPYTHVDAGQIYLYDRTTSWNLNRIETSTAPGSDGWFGYSVGLRGRHFVVGAPKEDQLVIAGSGNWYLLGDTGAAYFGVWDRPAGSLSGVDNPTAYYVGESNFTGISQSFFGATVGISPDLRVAIGAPYHSWTAWNSTIAPFLGGSLYYLNWNGQLGAQFDSPISLLNINNLYSGDGFGSLLEWNAATREFWVASDYYQGAGGGSSWLVVAAANGSSGVRVAELTGHDPDADPVTYAVVNGSPVSGVTFASQAIQTGGTGLFEMQTDASGAKWLAVKSGTNPISGSVHSVGVQVSDDRGGNRTFYTNVRIDGGSEFTDADLDGIDDSWEASHLLSSSNPADALLDVDGDGLTALEEFQRSRAGQTDGIDPNQWDLAPNGDEDGDGIANKEDADPFNPNVLKLEVIITQPGLGTTI